MKFYLYFALVSVLAITAFPALVLADVTINQTFSGVVNPTMVDTNGDGEFAGAASFHATGSPGRGTIQAIAEFSPMIFTGIPGCELHADLVQESFVETFKDLSMLFFEATEAENCVDLATFEISGRIAGIITGGTGRFEGATGDFSIDFEAIPVGVTQSVLIGTSTGTIVIPD
jgi:hypothetical protein